MLNYYCSIQNQYQSGRLFVQLNLKMKWIDRVFIRSYSNCKSNFENWLFVKCSSFRSLIWKKFRSWRNIGVYINVWVYQCACTFELDGIIFDSIVIDSILNNLIHCTSFILLFDRKSNNLRWNCLLFDDDDLTELIFDCTYKSYFTLWVPLCS